MLRNDGRLYQLTCQREITPADMSLLATCTCDGLCCVGRTMVSSAERAQITTFAGVDYFVPWSETLWYLDRGRCGYLLQGRCSVQAIKPFVCQIYPLVPRVIDGALWLLLVDECPGAGKISPGFIDRAVCLTRTFFKDLPLDEYAEYWAMNKVGDFDDGRVRQRILVMPENATDPFW